MIDRCKKHLSYKGILKPNQLFENDGCEECWEYYLHKKHKSEEDMKRTQRIKDFEKNNPGWTYGRRGPR